MGERAAIESVESLTRFRASLCKFAETIGVALAEADAEIRRTVSWLQQDQPNYWKNEIRKRQEVYARARGVLKRKQCMKTPLGGRYSTIDEEKVVAAAERRLEEAKQKQQNTKRWSRVLDEESYAYKAVAQGLSQIAEVDVANALAGLDGMIDALEAYATSTAPTRQKSLAASEAGAIDAGDAESMARETPDVSPLLAFCVELRARTPSDDERHAAAFAETPLKPPLMQSAGDSVREALSAIDLERDPPRPGARITIARGVDRCERTYLERRPAAHEGDSGWFIGSADSATREGYDAASVSDLLAECPGLVAALEMPVGSLIVLNKESVEAIVSPNDTLLWRRSAT